MELIAIALVFTGLALLAALPLVALLHVLDATSARNPQRTTTG